MNSIMVSVCMASTVGMVTGITSVDNTIINTVWASCSTSLYTPWVSRQEYDDLANKVLRLEKLLNVQEKKINKYDI